LGDISIVSIWVSLWLPKLKYEYKNNLSILSIAYDKNKQNVIDYTLKNEMNWVQIFIEKNMRNRNNSNIINQLRITEYPTLILIDNSNKIIFRGTGIMAIQNIRNILNIH